MLFSSPARMANNFVDQLTDVLTSELDRVMPLKAVMKPLSGNPINKFLIQEAIGAKQER